MSLISSIFGGLIAPYSLEEKPNIDVQMIAILFLIGFAFVLAIQFITSCAFRQEMKTLTIYKK